MRKHIIGLILFSSIVGAAAIVYAVFNISNRTSDSTVKYQTPLYVPFERTHCKMRREIKQSEDSSPAITQAVFNTKTKNLTWELASPRIVDFPIMHLFIKDEKGVRLLHSIHTVRYFTDADATKFSNQYLEIRKVSPQANLYLIPDMTASSAENESEQHDVMFDINKAIPVTIDYGK